MQWPDIFTSIWGLALILGPVVFIGVIVWVIVHNRQTPREEAATEQATHDLYEDGAGDERDRG